MTTESGVEGSQDGQMLWYVLKIQSNREKTIRDSLLRRMRQEGLQDYFGEIVIPTEKIVENRNGKKRVIEQKLYPGYLMIQMVLNDDTWYLVRSTAGVGDFTGSAGKPSPMPMHEVHKMLGASHTIAEEPAKVKHDLKAGDNVKIIEGPFGSFDGTVGSVDASSGKLTVMIEIFGRSTPVDVEAWQVERV
ncbi:MULTISPECIES: transcription termination/antitermination protein NusG [unclassified Schlesneria]|uniref:transcription termination/antitermination protein NusG n=1 Tax=Schlesneria TaxID=656899 RepID=UPI002EDD43C2